jgi:uncharacterized protein YndB with AHSA1/START domain
MQGDAEMVRVDASVDINVPVQQVFQYVATNYPFTVRQWTPSVQQIQQTSSGPVNIGTTFDQVRLVRGNTVQAQSRVTEFVPDHRFAVHATSPEQQVNAVYTFEPLGGGTRMSVSIDLDGNFPKLAGPIVSRELKKQTEEDLQRLMSTLGG